ncbi:MAG: hypothetical protein CVT64_09785 [Actinobacteria bacterium HGW-Actinobacteria-4]|nr:MAG: hypothetical protein CVT64_09785 [Actinobacteria bacterium HGW-Actinobacteria-4]
MRIAVPVTPDAETAREWAIDELSDPIYSQGESWSGRISRWITDFLADLFSNADGASIPVVGLLALAVVIVVAIIAIIMIVKPILEDRRRRSSVVMEDDSRSASVIRRAAKEAGTRQDWTLAVLESFRAIVAGMEERAIIDERAGRTAYEAARDGGSPLPGLASDLLGASRTFDAICYGHRPATEADYIAMNSLDRSVIAARPNLHERSTA